MCGPADPVVSGAPSSTPARNDGERRMTATNATKHARPVSNDIMRIFAAAFVVALAGQTVSDEQALRDIQQGLVRAWAQKDRAFIERVLAPEWSVTQADGSQLTRETVLGTFFDAVFFDSNVVDDVTVQLFGDTAIVRGRTIASGKFNGAPFTARIRFTDVFLKRNGRWQAIASHASPAPVERKQFAIGGQIKDDERHERDR